MTDGKHGKRSKPTMTDQEWRYIVMNNDELKWSLQAARSNVEVIDVDDYRDLLNRGQYALCILIYALSRTDKLTPELQSEVDDIVSSYDEKKREWLKYR